MAHADQDADQRDIERAREIAESHASTKLMADRSLEEFARQVGVPFDGSSAALTRLREIAKRGTIASLCGRFRPEGIIVHEPQRYALGVDLASGPDRTVVTTMRREGLTYVLDDLMPPYEFRSPLAKDYSRLLDRREYVVREARRRVDAELAHHPARARYITPSILRAFGFIAHEATPRR